MPETTCITRAFSSIHVSGNLTWLGTNRITATSPSVPITLPARSLSCMTPLTNMFKVNLAPRRIAQRHHLSIFTSKGLLTEARNRYQKKLSDNGKSCLSANADSLVSEFRQPIYIFGSMLKKTLSIECFKCCLIHLITLQR